MCTWLEIDCWPEYTKKNYSDLVGIPNICAEKKEFSSFLPLNQRENAFRRKCLICRIYPPFQVIKFFSFFRNTKNFCRFCFTNTVTADSVLFLFFAYEDFLRWYLDSFFSFRFCPSSSNAVIVAFEISLSPFIIFSWFL